MALKDIFTMVKADRYTADGCEVLNKAREADVEDRRYNIGEISEKTGLQKTAQGWKPPKETKFGKVKQNKEGQWGVQTKQGKGSDFLKHKSEKEASRALANYTAGYNTTERSKQDPHSDQARQVKHWDKETEKIRKQNRAEGRAAHAAQFQKPENKPADETDSAGNKRPSTDVAYLKGSKDPQLKADVKKAIATHHATGNNLLNVLYNKDKELYKKLDAMGTTNAEQFINQLAHDSAPRVLTGDCRIRIRKEKPALTGDTKIRVRK